MLATRHVAHVQYYPSARALRPADQPKISSRRESQCGPASAADTRVIIQLHPAASSRPALAMTTVCSTDRMRGYSMRRHEGRCGFTRLSRFVSISQRSGVAPLPITPAETRGRTAPKVARHARKRPPKARSRSIFREIACALPISEAVAFQHLRCASKTLASPVACLHHADD